MCVWWFVYLFEYYGCFVDYVRVVYFVEKVVFFMSMFFYIGEYRDIVVFLCDVVD